MVRGDSLKPSPGADPGGVLTCGLEVVAMHDQLRAEAPHGRVLVRAVALRDDDRDVDPRCPPGESQALAVVAAGGGHDPLDARPTGAQPLRVYQAAADLERPGGGVILVLHPDLGA